ncbi:MAG: TatD family hydrolase [Patescibacteria group bacterium]|nr:TatD family hydrolase [Patescibacteria group bacterium]
MKLFDTHCHLNIPPLKEIYNEVIENAQKNGVKYIVIPGTNFEDSLTALEISNKFENIYCALGFHPNELIKRDLREIILDLNEIKKYLEEKKVIAVGEIGLDKKRSNLKLQKELFLLQIKLAKEYKKPLIIHNREMGEEIIKVLKKEWDEFFRGKIVFHCTEPDEKILKFAKEKNIYLGFDGDLTYREDKQNFVKKVPLNLIVLETDSPFLLPEPLKTFVKHQTHTEEIRFYPNKPENLIIIFNFLANLLKMNRDLLTEKLFENSLKLFGLR